MVSITDISRIGQDNADRLRSAGIRTTDRLLDAAKNPKGRKLLAEETGIELLREAGVDTVKELKYRNPARLAEAMAEVNARRKLVRVLPSDRAVVRWIEHAKRLPLKISYK
jgi:hypothetical protein